MRVCIVYRRYISLFIKFNLFRVLFKMFNLNWYKKVTLIKGNPALPERFSKRVSLSSYDIFIGIDIPLESSPKTSVLGKPYIDAKEIMRMTLGDSFYKPKKFIYTKNLAAAHYYVQKRVVDFYQYQLLNKKVV